MTMPERSLLQVVCSQIYAPYYPNPESVLVPYVQAFQEVFKALPGGWGDQSYAAILESFGKLSYASWKESGWEEFSWGYVQRVAMLLAGNHSQEVMDGILLPLRLIERVPTDFYSVVESAIPNLGIAAALEIPGVVVRGRA